MAENVQATLRWSALVADLPEGIEFALERSTQVALPSIGINPVSRIIDGEEVQRYEVVVWGTPLEASEE